ncbi:MAG: single-stranded DNA-binding protein [Lachnospiraceae bacterium]|nr:single-stranded DNA-binding protein [Clostridia bacterium]MBR7075745.1 single-stranded DNA-binding protein [Lachnospiraceae bacterium]
MANFNFNKVILGGRLTDNPELKSTGTGVNYVNFSIAVNRPYSKNDGQQQNVDFINVVAWRQRAEFVTRYFKKGSSICIVGSIQTRNWTDQQGNKRYATDVVADEVSFVDSKNDSQGSAQSSSFVPDNYQAPAFSSDNAPKFEDVSEDEDLPF